jgi:hypothetical protein
VSDVRTTGHLTDALADINRWYPGTADPPRTLTSHTRITYGSRPPLPADVLSLRAETVDTLTSWALLVCQERDLHGPSPACPRRAQRVVIPFAADRWPWVCGCTRQPGRPLLNDRLHDLPADVSSLTRFLSAQAEWLAGFDGDHAAHELGHLAHLLEQVVRQTTPARVKRIAPCPEPGCPGTLEAVVRKDDDLLPSNVFCSADRAHQWQPGEWHALGRRTQPLNPSGVARLLKAL